jgi:mycothiol synthase
MKHAHTTGLAFGLATFDPATGGEWPAGLELVLRTLAADARTAIINDTLAALRAGRPAEGLLIARRGSAMAAAIWVELQPGRAAGVWPPAVAAGESPDLAAEMLARALDDLRRHDVQIAQALLSAGSLPAAPLFQAAGFLHAADLLYLLSTTAQFPHAPITTPLSFEPLAADNPRLLAAVEASYEQTLDCPALNGRREGRDVLADYLAAAGGDSSHWYVVRQERADVGCLLLGRHADGESWELTYMGLAPAARRRGWGIDLVRQAQWLVGQGGGERLVLAVDASNAPAVKVYAAAGFFLCDQRSVFLKTLATA